MTLRKRTNHKPSAAAMFRLLDSMVDFFEDMPTQPSPLEGRRQDILAAAEKAGYKTVKPKG